MYHVRFLGEPDKDKGCPIMGNIYFSEEQEEKAMGAAKVAVKNGFYPFAQVFHDGEFVKIYVEE